MKILYVSPENTVGLLTIWKEIHKNNGHEARFITMYPSKQKFDNGICLNLPFINTSDAYINSRNLYYKITRGPLGDQEIKSNKSIYNKSNLIEKIYFPIRDQIWKRYFEKIIREYNLFDFDYYHFEWGMDIYRNFSFVKKLKKMNKPIIAHYHGQDIRTRGIFYDMDQMADLNLTSEIDLMGQYKKLNYLPLPFIFPPQKPSFKINATIKICHATTNRYYKGSELIIRVCRRLEKENSNVKFLLIENKSHEELMKIKGKCDINIDQIGDKGGWGYGMNSVEAMSMGLCVATEINAHVENIIGDHPFINIDKNNLYDKMNKLVSNKKKIEQLKQYSYEWGIINHSAKNVSEKLYNLYKTIL